MAAAAVTQGLGSCMKQHFNKYKLCACVACRHVWLISA